MKAAIIKRYGTADALRIQDMPRPTPAADELLVRIRASSVNPVDWKIRQGVLKLITGRKFPMILGADFSGEVAAVGANITAYKVGQQVYGMINATKGGAYAEYLAVKTSKLVPKPAGISHEEAAAVPLAGLTALQSLKKGGIQAGQQVLVIGASGGVGSFAVQIAKAYQATVTAVCSGRNVAMVRQLGADRVIDYEQEAVLPQSSAYNLILDAHGHMPFSKARKALHSGGQFITTLPSAENIFWLLAQKLVGDKGLHIIATKVNPTDLGELSRLIEESKLKSVIDSVFSLDDIDEAHRKSETGHVSGKIVIKIDEGEGDPM